VQTIDYYPYGMVARNCTRVGDRATRDLFQEGNFSTSGIKMQPLDPQKLKKPLTVRCNGFLADGEDYVYSSASFYAGRESVMGIDPVG
jgi:hypothetical protein